MVTPNSVAEHLGSLSPEIRESVEKLRAKVLELVPEAVETISYGIPTVKMRGRGIVHYAGFKNHCSFFPGGAIVDRYAEELQGYKTSKGTIQFTPDHPLPDALIEKIIRDRIEAELPKMKE
ncbi:MAG: DUF1801 domain-containing protein [Armatimonadetes bacterium]|nr:DUF1801 domain-containing protein [Armatimonadota bacterium]